MKSRADLIYEILQNNGGRMKVSDVAEQLSGIEGGGHISSSVISSTARVDNRTRDRGGRAPRFNTFGDGGEIHGNLSVRDNMKTATNLRQIMANPSSQLPKLIEKANRKVRADLKKAIKKISWQKFESNFLLTILESLGFTDITITQPTRDGGQDARCKYKRGIVVSEVIVSAKHWQSKNIAPLEVQRLRGLQGNADTAVIVTSGTFSKRAKTEAEPAQGFRSVVLIDGDLIVNTCLSSDIGVIRVTTPVLYQFVNLMPWLGDEEDNTLL